MAWDDIKQPSDLIQSSEWNDMVSDQKSRIENNAGVDMVNQSVRVSRSVTTNENLTKKIVASGESVTVPTDFSMVIAGDYTVNGTLEVNGTFAVV